MEMSFILMYLPTSVCWQLTVLYRQCISGRLFLYRNLGGGGRGEAEKTCVKKLLRGYRSLHYNIRIHLCVNK